MSQRYDLTTSGDAMAAPGEKTTVTYTLTNQGSTSASAGGLEPNLPAGISIADVSGDGTNSPARFFTSPISAGESVSVDYTFAVDANATLGTVTVGMNGSINVDDGTRSTTADVDLEISETTGLPTDPGEPGFTDVLGVIAAFNTGQQFNGVSVEFTDVLDVITAFNAGT